MREAITLDWLDGIEMRAEAATPGPWWWGEEFFRTRHMKRTHAGLWRAKPGRRARDTHALLLVGCGPGGPYMPESPSWDNDPIDEWDFPGIIRLQWEDLRSASWTGGPKNADCHFIAAARTDIPVLIAEVRRLRALLAEVPA